MTFAEGLIHFFAGPDLGEAIAGDLYERSETEHSPAAAFWVATARAMPGLVRLSLQNLSATRVGCELGWIATFLTFAWVWETKVAQIFAWPIASAVNELSPLSTTVTCKIAYLSLFVFGGAILMAGWRYLTAPHRTCWRVRTQRLLAVIVAGMIPVLYLLAVPGPHDGSPLFRYVQVVLLLILGGVAVFAFRSNLKPA